jgi:hypothetical protein
MSIIPTFCSTIWCLGSDYNCYAVDGKSKIMILYIIKGFLFKGWGGLDGKFRLINIYRYQIFIRL